ncbi:MAG: thiamine phosphate synthase [Erysipelotrichaceae bacterium]|nr:thiamine phosphate synthase [Erysipelotrichaceae bacterium]
MKFTKSMLKLYAVTDRSWLNGDTLYQQVEKALKGGVTMVQLREKNLGYEQFLQEAIEMKALCHRYHVPLIINDNLEVAINSDADGIHIGQDDISIDVVKERFPDKIIGVTAHNLKEANIAQENGATYLGMGAIFSTSTKTNTTPLSINSLKEITSIIHIPIVAIGGITYDNVDKLKNTGIAGIAVVSAIFHNDDIVSSTKALLNKMVYIE